MVYYRQIASGAVVTDSCCSSASAPPLPCGLCTGSGITIDMNGAVPINPDPTACYSFITNGVLFLGEFCVTFTSGITLYLPYSNAIYPPTGYSLTGVQSINTNCSLPSNPDSLVITACDQTGSIADFYNVIENDIATGNNAIVSLTSATGCSSIYTANSSKYLVLGATDYSVTCLPVTRCDLCPNVTDNVNLVCNTNANADPAVCYNFTNPTLDSMTLIIYTSNIKYKVQVASGATYPPSNGISGVTAFGTSCPGYSCSSNPNTIVIISVTQAGSLPGDDIVNLSGVPVIISLSNGTDCVPVYLANGDKICSISNATQYAAAPA